MNPLDGHDIEGRLAELGTMLDQPAGNDLMAKVGARLTDRDELATARRSHRPRRMAVLVAAVAVVLAVVAIPTSRHAIANLFRSGGVEFRGAKDFHHRRAVSTTTTTSGPSQAGPGLSAAAAQQAVQFPLRLPQLVPARTPTITVDRSVPGGLVSLDYGEFRVVEVAAGTAPPVIAKGLDSKTEIEAVTVGAAPGVWITGTHHVVAYLDRDGNVRQDSVREQGHVLLWASEGVTFRVEGFQELAGARQVADSIR